MNNEPVNDELNKGGNEKGNVATKPKVYTPVKSVNYLSKAIKLTRLFHEGTLKTVAGYTMSTTSTVYAIENGRVPKDKWLDSFSSLWNTRTDKVRAFADKLESNPNMDRRQVLGAYLSTVLA